MDDDRHPQFRPRQVDDRAGTPGLHRHSSGINDPMNFGLRRNVGRLAKRAGTPPGLTRIVQSDNLGFRECDASNPAL
jgi:hypothetical protein